MNAQKGNLLGVVVAAIVVGYCGFVVYHIAQVASADTMNITVPEVVVVAEKDAGVRTVSHDGMKERKNHTSTASRI